MLSHPERRSKQPGRVHSSSTGEMPTEGRGGCVNPWFFRERSKTRLGFLFSLQIIRFGFGHLWCCFARHCPQHYISVPSVIELAVAWLGPLESRCLALPFPSPVWHAGGPCREFYSSSFNVPPNAYVFISAAFSPFLCPALCPVFFDPCHVLLYNPSCNCLVPAGMSKKSSNPVVSLTSGCIAGAVEAICVWPLEFVKASLSNSGHVFLLFVNMVMMMVMFSHYSRP